MVDEPAIGMLATAAGLAVVVALITNLIRPAMVAATFDRIGPLIAVIVGVVLALTYAWATEPSLSGSVLLQAFLVGLFGGVLSQNVNTVVARATRED